jgi:hypothetical protein
MGRGPLEAALASRVVHSTGMDDERSLPGAPQLHRQELPLRRDVAGRPLVPARVPESRPTPLQGAFIYLSVIVLACGVVSITAVELGTPLGAPLVRIPALIGGTLLALVTTDAIVRIWRSAWAWLPIDRGRGLFRFVWVAALAAGLGGLAVGAWILLRAQPS